MNEDVAQVAPTSDGRSPIEDSPALAEVDLLVGRWIAGDQEAGRLFLERCLAADEQTLNRLQVLWQEFVGRDPAEPIDVVGFVGMLAGIDLAGSLGREASERLGRVLQTLWDAAAEHLDARVLLARDRKVQQHVINDRHAASQERNKVLGTALNHLRPGRRSDEEVARRCETWLSMHESEAFNRLFPPRGPDSTGKPLPRVTRYAVRTATGKKRPRR